MKVEQAVDPGEWNAFVDRHATAPPIRWEWGTLCERYGHDRHYLLARDGDGVAGVAPLVHLSHPLLSDKLISVPFSEFGGVYARTDAARDRLLERAADLADSLGVAYLEFRGSDLGSAHPETTVEERYVTFELDLTEGDDAVWDGCETRFRTNVRKARDEGVSVEEVTGEEGLRRFYRLYLRTMRGHGTPPHSFAYFREMFDRFGDEGRITVRLATFEGTDINGMHTLTQNGRTVYASSVSNYAYRSKNGGSLLLWRAIEDACERGVETFDLGRTREGSGVYMYKKSLSGTKVGLPDTYYFPGEPVSPPDPEDTEYELASRVWRRLPLRVTEVVGPSIRKWFP